VEVWDRHARLARRLSFHFACGGIHGSFNVDNGKSSPLVAVTKTGVGIGKGIILGICGGLTGRAAEEPFRPVFGIATLLAFEGFADDPISVADRFTGCPELMGPAEGEATGALLAPDTVWGSALDVGELVDFAMIFEGGDSIWKGTTVVNDTQSRQILALLVRCEPGPKLHGTLEVGSR
jgi:hypothetical protein